MAAHAFADLDAFAAEFLRTGGSPDQPQKLLDHAPPEDAFRGQQGEPAVAQTEPELAAEH